MTTHKHLSQLIGNFGISPRATDLYLTLVKTGPLGIMDLTRRSGLGRNIVYKLLDELTTNQLVSVSNKSFGKVYTALQGASFDSLLASKQAHVATLRTSLDEVAAGLLALAGSDQHHSDIVHYEGREGLKQVNWNLTKASKEFRVYEQSHVDDYLDQAFADRLRQRYMEKGLVSYDITNRTEVPAYKNVPKDFHWKQNSHYRHIDPQILDIQFEMYTYDDVVTLLDYSSALPHCIEIHNPKLARMQQQIFDIVWSQATEMIWDGDVRKVKN